jgi:nitrile hydratase beta subunit
VIGPHDLGGAKGFGPVRPEPNEPVFHADWERRVFGMVMAVSYWRRWTLDTSRHEREQIPAADYLPMTYYERWFAGLTARLNKSGLINERPSEPPLQAKGVSPQRIRAEPPKVDGKPGRFHIGDAVRTRVIEGPGHTRLPGYAQSRTGVIAAQRGQHLLPDDSAAGKPRNVQALYSVRFDAHDLFGEAKAGDAIFLDLWDDYLDPA